MCETDKTNESGKESSKTSSKANSEKKRIELTPAAVQSHIDIITSLHCAIADTSENRKRLESHICKVCCKIGCTGRGRCRATDVTMAQINLLTGLVVIRDEGSMELGIGEYDRIITIGEALEPFNPALADYFKEDGVQALHTTICIAKNKNVSLGKLNIPAEYNVKVDRLLDR